MNTQTPKTPRYSDDQWKTLEYLAYELHTPNRDPGEGIMRVKLNGWKERKDGSFKLLKSPVSQGHWKTGKANAGEAWMKVPALDKKYFDIWSENDMGVIGGVPVKFGIVGLDIDAPDDPSLSVADLEALVIGKHGAPLSACNTPSNGRHLFYPVKYYADGNDHIRWPASKFYIDGVAIGETCCAARWANIWSPEAWVQAIEKRLLIDDDAKLIDHKSIERMASNDATEADTEADTERTNIVAPVPSKNASNALLEAFVDTYDMTPRASKKGTFEGTCPGCGGDTRFTATTYNGNISFTCWSCEPEGKKSTSGTYDRVKILNAVRHRGDYMNAFSRAMRKAKRATSGEELQAELATMLAKYTLGPDQIEAITSKSKSVFVEASEEREQVKAHKETLHKRRQQLADKQEKKQERKEARKAAIRENPTKSRFQTLEEKSLIPYERGDIDCFDWCMDKLGYQGRINVILGREEVISPYDPGVWVNVSDDVYRTIWRSHAANFTWEPDDDAEYVPVKWGGHDQRTMYIPWVHFNRYNPWEDYILSLPEWDGVERLATSMERGGMEIYAGAHPNSEEIKRWAQMIMWVDCVRFGLFPGSQRYAELLLLGHSGYGKSQFAFRALPEYLRNDYFDDGSANVDDTDKVQIEYGAKLLGEGTEFGGGYKKDWVKAKQMITKRVYNARVAYGEKTTIRPRADTKVHTTNEPVLPDDDPAVHRRLISVQVVGRVDADADKGILPFHYLDDDVINKDGTPMLHKDGTPITNRDMCWAEAWHIVRNCGSKHFSHGHREGLWGKCCDFNLMPSRVASDEDGLMEHNKHIGATYLTTAGGTGIALTDIIEHLHNDHSDGESVGAVYADNGHLAGIKRRGLYGLIHFSLKAHDIDDCFTMTKERIMDAEPDLTAIGINKFRQSDDREGLTTQAMQRYLKVITGSGLFVQSHTKRNLPLAPKSGRDRWFEYTGYEITDGRAGYDVPF